MRNIFANINTYLETCFLVFAIILLLIHIHAATMYYPSPGVLKVTANDTRCQDNPTTEVIWKLKDNAESTYTERLVVRNPKPLPVPEKLAELTSYTNFVSTTSAITDEELTTIALIELQCTAPLETPFVIVNASELLISQPAYITTQTACQDDPLTASPTPVRHTFAIDCMATPAYEGDLTQGTSLVEISETNDHENDPTPTPVSKHTKKKKRSRRR